jgi:membrane protein DedA with SNARE-associated domain
MEFILPLFFGTFVLEDVALASALVLVALGKLGAWPAFLTCFIGISLGDLALYGIGAGLRKSPLTSRSRVLRNWKEKLERQLPRSLLTYSVIVSRFIPGTRTATYLAAGFLLYPFGRFTVLTVITVLPWVALAFVAGNTARPLLVDHWLLTTLFALLFLSLAKNLGTALSDRWERRALLHSWRRWGSFEFLPATLFYLPLVPYYVFLSLRHGGLLTPFYANPEIENGGLIGESKWDFLQHLDPASPTTLKAVKIPRGGDALAVITREGFSFPFILKPDVGQRGFGVRIIRDYAGLADYIRLADFDVIAQRLSHLPGEAGIFYVKYPSAARGFLFSLTDKRFPLVVGNGNSTLGDLILADPRARKIASTYFARHRAFLDEVLPAGSTFQLTACGNHCQGAIFLNGHSLISPALTTAVSAIADKIPKFQFGRFDVRYQNPAALTSGANFEIVEINGAGAEATHIWDGNTRLFEAYGTLFTQWRMLFEIGAECRKNAVVPARIHRARFVRECIKVFFRKVPLSVSS